MLDNRVPVRVHDYQSCPGTNNPVQFSYRGINVRHVLEDLSRHGRVKTVIRKRHLGRVALANFNPSLMGAMPRKQTLKKSN
jgi:hypothetical protein